MNTWYVAINGQQQGPFPQNHIQQSLSSGVYSQDTLVWREGFQNWLPISQVPELNQAVGFSTQSPPGMSGLQAHEIDFEIFGTEMQFVEVELDPNESAVAEAGAMMYMSDSIQMETVFGDGSHASETGSFMDKMLGAGKRLITGESLFTTVFTFKGQGKGKVAFAAPYPGKIIPLDLKKYNGKLVCQKEAFLCAAKGVAIGVEFQKKNRHSTFRWGRVYHAETGRGWSYFCPCRRNHHRKGIAGRRVAENRYRVSGGVDPDR